MKLLVIGLGREGVEGAQLAGFDMCRAELEAAGIVFRRVDLFSLPTIERAITSSNEDVVIFMPHWSWPPEEVRAMTERVASQPGRPKLILLDHFAQSSSPFFDVLPHVDVYAKRQVLRDKAAYEEEMLGGFIFTDFFTRSTGFDLEDWHFGSTLDRAHAHKLIHAWNLGVYPLYRRTVDVPALPWLARPIDVHCRLAIGKHSQKKWEWYSEYRTRSREAIEPLGERYRLSGQDQIRRVKYFLELARSKMTFSPFGWGELCIRDYEAVAFGALLVKPSMEHVVTSPDIYRPNETYVPVKWDNSDLVERCEYYLEHPREGEEIAKNARAVLRRYFKENGFVADVKRVVES